MGLLYLYLYFFRELKKGPFENLLSCKEKAGFIPAYNFCQNYSTATREPADSAVLFG